MIVALTDFVNRPYKIPNKVESVDLTSILAAEEERLAVQYLLGYELWTIINSSSPASPYNEIVSGATYTYGGKQYRYNGWVDLVRPALFAHWIPETSEKLTNVGFVQNNAQEKSKNLDDYYPKVVEHWNEFVLKVGVTVCFGYNYQGSFYGFMRVNRTSFPEWQFRAPKFKNRYDL